MGTLIEDLEIVEKAIDKMAGKILEEETNRIYDLEHQSMEFSTSIVALSTNELALLRRVAELASDYSRLRLWETRKELFGLAEEWRKQYSSKVQEKK